MTLVEKLEIFYKLKLVSKEQLKEMVLNNLITQEDYKNITMEEFTIQ